MKPLNNSFNVNFNSAELFAQSLGGKVEGNFIIVPESINRGIMYYLNCAPGINALYVDAEYDQDVLFREEVIEDSYIGIYFNLTKGEADFGFKNSSHPIGNWHYDLIVLDSAVKSDYLIKKGTKSSALNIFIKKDVDGSDCESICEFT